MMKNACIHCRIYFPENGTLYSCPQCMGSLNNIDDAPGFRSMFYHINTAEIEELRSAASRAPVRIPEEPRVTFSTPPPPAPPVAAPVLTPRVEELYTDYDTEPALPAPNADYYGRITSYVIDDMEQTFFERVGGFFRGMHTGHSRHTIE